MKILVRWAVILGAAYFFAPRVLKWWKGVGA